MHKPESNLSSNQSVHAWIGTSLTDDTCKTCGKPWIDPAHKEQPSSKDIVTALREYNYWLAGPNNEDESSLVAAAADEIDRLQQKLTVAEQLAVREEMVVEPAAASDFIRGAPTKAEPPTPALFSQERHALFIGAQEARDPTAVKWLLRLYDRTAPTKEESHG